MGARDLPDDFARAAALASALFAEFIRLQRTRRRKTRPWQIQVMERAALDARRQRGG